jgi:hypothetical protein
VQQGSQTLELGADAVQAVSHGDPSDARVLPWLLGNSVSEKELEDLQEKHARVTRILWNALGECIISLEGALQYKPESLVKKHNDMSDVAEYRAILNQYKEKP